MVLTKEKLESRLDDLQHTLSFSEEQHQSFKEQARDIKKEIANIKGAVIEIRSLLSDCEAS